MKNRIFIFIVALVAVGLFSINNLVAQNSASLKAHNTGFIDVTSYNGHVSSGIFIVRVDIKGTENDSRDWSLLVRSKDIITNNITIIDPSNISVRLNHVEVGPNLNQLTPVPLSLEEKDLIVASGINDPIMPPPGKNNTQWIFHFDILVAPGSYLEPLKSWDQYRLNLEFILQNVERRISDVSVGVNLRINPNLTGTPPSGPSFGFEIKADASLNFDVPEDYTKKVESSEDSWLKVSSKTSNYVVKVHTSDHYFEGQSDIPVDIVSMQVEDKKDSRTGPGISLKNDDQTVFTGNATGSETRKLDVRYFITENEAKGLATYRPGAYTTRLTYTLLPQ